MIRVSQYPQVLAASFPAVDRRCLPLQLEWHEGRETAVTPETFFNS